MVVSYLEIVSVAATAYFFWLLTRHYIRRSPLNNLHGPPPPSVAVASRSRRSSKCSCLYPGGRHIDNNTPASHIHKLLFPLPDHLLLVQDHPVHTVHVLAGGRIHPFHRHTLYSS